MRWRDVPLSRPGREPPLAPASPGGTHSPPTSHWSRRADPLWGCPMPAPKWPVHDLVPFSSLPNGIASSDVIRRRRVGRSGRVKYFEREITFP